MNNTTHNLSKYKDQDIEDLKQLAMDSMQVKRGRRDEIKKVLDAFAYFISKNATAKNITIDRTSSAKSEPLDTRILDTDNAGWASPFANPEDHQTYIAQQKLASIRKKKPS